jgi:ribosomal protein S18 acetylase RimI-like enzyme
VRFLAANRPTHTLTKFLNEFCSKRWFIVSALVASKQQGEQERPDGISQVNLRRDLGAIADLIELCFAATIDEAGRAAVREMRAISQSGALSALFSGLDKMLGGLELGFVWYESGRLVGNVSLSRAELPSALGRGYVVANVAVHPDWRRRGIAEQLLYASEALLRTHGAMFAILQVDIRNEGAQALYEKLGFRAERAFTRWTRPIGARLPQRPATMPYITLRQGNEWRAEFDLARYARPNEQGGIGWLMPAHPDFFRPAPLRDFGRLLAGKRTERWIVRGPDNRQIVGALQAVSSFGSANKLLLLVDPAWRGQLEMPLLNYAVRRLDSQDKPIQIEHPYDDAIANRALDDLGFRPQQSLLHMRRHLA